MKLHLSQEVTQKFAVKILCTSFLEQMLRFAGRKMVAGRTVYVVLCSAAQKKTCFVDVCTELRVNVFN
jgi:hypothetical protein